MENEARIPEWLRKKMLAVPKKDQLEKELQEKIDRGDITVEEAEHEWHDIFDPEPRYCGSSW